MIARNYDARIGLIFFGEATSPTIGASTSGANATRYSRNFFQTGLGNFIPFGKLQILVFSRKGNVDARVFLVDNVMSDIKIGFRGNLRNVDSNDIFIFVVTNIIPQNKFINRRVYVEVLASRKNPLVRGFVFVPGQFLQIFFFDAKDERARVDYVCWVRVYKCACVSRCVNIYIYSARLFERLSHQPVIVHRKERGERRLLLSLLFFRYTNPSQTRRRRVLNFFALLLLFDAYYLGEKRKI